MSAAASAFACAVCEAPTGADLDETAEVVSGDRFEELGVAPSSPLLRSRRVLDALRKLALSSAWLVAHFWLSRLTASSTLVRGGTITSGGLFDEAPPAVGAAVALAFVEGSSFPPDVDHRGWRSEEGCGRAILTVVTDAGEAAVMAVLRLTRTAEASASSVQACCPRLLSAGGAGYILNRQKKEKAEYKRSKREQQKKKKTMPVRQ